MQKIITAIIACLFGVSCYGTFIIYKTTLAEFIGSRDVVFKGVVVAVNDLEAKMMEPMQDSEECPKQIATVRITEILKNSFNDRRIRDSGEILIVVENCEYRLAGIQYHDAGFEGFWIIDTKKDNFGMDTERALQALNREDEIRSALKRN